MAHDLKEPAKEILHENTRDDYGDKNDGKGESMQSLLLDLWVFKMKQYRKDKNKFMGYDIPTEKGKQ